MKNSRRTLHRTLPVIAALMSFGTANAQWATVTSTNGVNETAFFSGSATNPAFYPWLGAVNVTASKIVDGGSDGVPGLTAGAFSNVTPTFLANLPLNFSGTLDSFGFSYNHTRDSYHVAMDFTGMQFGVLPAGTIFTVLDLDIEEQFTHMGALDSSGQIITSAWLSPDSGVLSHLDFNNAYGDQTGTFSPTPYTQVGGMYTFTGFGANYDSILTSFRTTTDIKRIEFDFSKYASTDYTHVGGAGIGLSYQAVPEPASLLAMGVGIAALINKRKRVQK